MERPALFCQRHTVRAAVEEDDAQDRFELAHLLRDSAGGHSQLFGGTAEIQMAARHLERVKGVQWRQRG